MSKKSLVISSIVLVVLATLIVFGIGAALTWLRSLESTLAAAVVTAIVGLFGLWYAQWHSKSRDIAESHRSSKIEVYNHFFEIVEKFQDDKTRSYDTREEDVSESLKRDFIKLNRGLILWASPSVITAWLRFRAASEKGVNILIAVDGMYQAIRKDLGNSNVGLKTGDLIKITLRDPSEWKS